jgi:hypothetical protein
LNDPRPTSSYNSPVCIELITNGKRSLQALNFTFFRSPPLVARRRGAVRLSMSTLLDDQDLDRKPSAEAAALAATTGDPDLAALQIPGASTASTRLPALAAQMAGVQPVASTSQVTLDLYGQPVPNAAAADDSDMEDSATEDEQLPQGTVGIDNRDDDDEETEEDEDSSDEETLRAVQKRQGQARRMEAVQGLYPGEQVLPDEEFGTKTVAGTSSPRKLAS